MIIFIQYEIGLFLKEIFRINTVVSYKKYFIKYLVQRVFEYKVFDYRNIRL